MKPISPTQGRTREHGLVLFFALIALVLLSLAALALVRSVDTTTLVAGNLAFRQSATQSGDGSIEQAIAALRVMGALDADNPAVGYYSGLGTSPNLGLAATWDNNNDRNDRNPNGISSPEWSDTVGNRMRYVIQRMCTTSGGAPTRANCVFTTGQAVQPLHSVATSDSYCGAACPTTGDSPLYRVTIRILGPNNTTSFIQALVN